jgi:hypothetical protein
MFTNVLKKGRGNSFYQPQKLSLFPGGYFYWSVQFLLHFPISLNFAAFNNDIHGFPPYSQLSSNQGTFSPIFLANFKSQSNFPSVCSYLLCVVRRSFDFVIHSWILVLILTESPNNIIKLKWRHHLTLYVYDINKAMIILRRQNRYSFQNILNRSSFLFIDRREICTIHFFLLSIEVLNSYVA